MANLHSAQCQAKLLVVSLPCILNETYTGIYNIDRESPTVQIVGQTGPFSASA
jgi:hypothetical protein